MMTFNHNLMPGSAIYQYGDVFLAHLQKEDSICTQHNSQHCLKYVLSGELVLEEGRKKTKVHAGECVFIRRDHKVRINKHALGDDTYMGITLMFNRPFLRDKYKSEVKGMVNEKLQAISESVYMLPSTPQLQSLFISITPFFNSDQEPSTAFLNHKMNEALLTLLELDERFYPTLFDFSDPWKIDLEDFMNKNYTSDLTMEEYACYTGRSLATFKRDFKKISNLPPQKWIIQKRLEKAYDMIANKHQGIIDTCYQVGFKNRSHFAMAFKRMYGITPSVLL